MLVIEKLNPYNFTILEWVATYHVGRVAAAVFLVSAVTAAAILHKE